MNISQLLKPALRSCSCFQRWPTLCSISHLSEQSKEPVNFTHTPVMMEEVLKALNPVKDGVYVDMTFGYGGHSRSLLSSAPDIKLYCLDRDPVAHEHAKTFAEEFKGQVVPLLGRFSEFGLLMKQLHVPKESINGFLFDVGCSSMQFDDGKRGFSVSKNGYLDMRMDGNRFPNHPTAADVINTLDYPNLVKIFKIYGEEKRAKKIAQALIDSRYLLNSIQTTKDLCDLVYNTVGMEFRKDKLQRPAHVATKIFQALRIFVNNELNELNYGIGLAHSYLKPEGRLVALTFHSLEDRIVKRNFHGINIDEPISHSLSQKYRNAALWHSRETMNEVLAKKWIPLYEKVITPSPEEVELNPRSRSAKMRFAAKCS